jgi:hypothetical protein
MKELTDRRKNEQIEGRIIIILIAMKKSKQMKVKRSNLY